MVLYSVFQSAGHFDFTSERKLLWHTWDASGRGELWKQFGATLLCVEQENA
jgi:hypothetical protein